MKVPFSPPDIGEKEIDKVREVLESGWITTGPLVKDFEKKIREYCSVDNAVCLNSATACLEGVLRFLGIGPGDEVILPSYTYTATASPVHHVGAKIVLVDSLKDSYEMDYNAIKGLITERTKAIIAVDLAGVICDYGKLFEIACDNTKFKASNDEQRAMGRIAIIADSAHGFGSTKNQIKSGNFADFTTFSFHAVKNLTTAEGGAVVWNDYANVPDDYIYKEFMLYSLHGQSKDALAKTGLGNWEYDIVNLGYKCNMTNIQAAMGLAQLERYEDILKRRRELIEAYEEGLSDLDVDYIKHYGDNFASSGHLFLLRIKGADEEYRNMVIEKMAELGVATNVHYKPLPMFTAYKNLGFDIKDFKNSYDQYKNGISLPLYSSMKDEEVQYVIDSFKKVLSENKI